VYHIVDYLGLISRSLRALLRAILRPFAPLPEGYPGRPEQIRSTKRETARKKSVPQRDGFDVAATPAVAGHGAAPAASPFHHLPADVALSAAGPSLELQFTRLAAEWKADTEFESSTTRIAMHPAYQRIIGMGAPVVPLILRDLERTNDPWFWALHAITGANPVAAEDRGTINRMVSAWLLWGMRTKNL
jgi:hypothetical protein